jgi:histidinol-phosphate aminotransferase
MKKETTGVRVERWVRPEIRALSAYQVPSSEGLLKLDAMENPYGWPDDLKSQWLELLQQVGMNRYPDPQAEGVKAGLLKVFGIPADYELLLGNGSDEIIQLLALAMTGSGRTILAPEPSFVMYRMIAIFTGMEYVGVPLEKDFDLDLSAMLEAIETHQPALVFLSQPNNPTGNLFGEEKIRRIIETSPGLVVVDEAYTAFTEADSLHLLGDYDNVVIMRTLSKVGLAGLRLGLLIGDGSWISQFEKLRLPYNINVLTQASAEFALQHFDVLTEQTQQLCQDRQCLYESLQALEGIKVWGSEANFFLVKMPEGRAGEIHGAMKGQGVLVKCLDGSHPQLKDCLRITVSTFIENEAMLAALRKAL